MSAILIVSKLLENKKCKIQSVLSGVWESLHLIFGTGAMVFSAQIMLLKSTDLLWINIAEW